MSETAERVGLPCPACSPAVDTVHEVLASGGGRATVRCTECNHVHKEPIQPDDDVERRVVVSQDGESFTASVDVPRDETLARGEEFVLETEEAIMEVRITDLQLDDEVHAEEAVAEDVETVFTRAVDNVSVRVTVNPSDGGHDDTEGITVHVPGDYEFEVGGVESFGDDEFRVTAIHVRDDAAGYEFDKLDHGGDAVLAKDAKRVYGVDETSDAWSAW